MSLTDKAIKNIQINKSSKKYFDGEGLYLLVKPNGSKLWRLDYRYLGKPKTASFGQYPEVSLLEAREKKSEARRILREGKDPQAEKKKRKFAAIASSGTTFEAVAMEWFDLNKPLWSEYHANVSVMGRLENHVFPKIGSDPISQISRMQFLNDVIRPIEEEGHTVVSKIVYRYCNGIFQLAADTKKIEHNPIAKLSGALKKHKTEHYPTIDISEVPEFLENLENVECTELERLALKFVLLTFVRSSEVLMTKWEYFDFDLKRWEIPADDMKMKREHWVPLSRQAIEVLKKIHEISGSGEYLFPPKRLTKYPYMHENALNHVLHKMGYKGKLVTHGLRSLASTTLNELDYRNKPVVDAQLAHSSGDEYNRAAYIDERTILMQKYADIIDEACIKAASKKTSLAELKIAA